MDVKINSLIAVGAAAALNCRPCVEHHVRRCLRAGVLECDVRKAIDTGFRVNRGAHAKTQKCIEGVIASTKEECNDGAAAQTCCS